MASKILILGASYGSLLGTKLAMAGHDVTLVCRSLTAKLINAQGTEVRIKLKGEDEHRAIRSADLPGRIDAVTPADADPSAYDMVGLAMQEPQYASHEMRSLMIRVAEAKVPCLSIMNMPPLAYSEAPAGHRRCLAGRCLYRSAHLGPVRAWPRQPLLSRPAGLPPAGGAAERAACRPANQLQGCRLRGSGP